MRVSRRAWMAGVAGAPGLVRALGEPPADVAFAASPALDSIVNAAVAANRMPGAVLIVGHQGRIVHRKAYGFRSLAPRREAMTLDTVFDIASLTKVVATVPLAMQLFEAGKLRIDDRVTEYLPEFQGGKSDLTLRNLMTHFSGLRPDLDLDSSWSGYETGIRMALAEKCVMPPGCVFSYSDINFILMGEIVRRLGGDSLAGQARAQIFAPLGMRATVFQPLASWRARIAPTENVKGQILRGVVHDPTARRMGGVAGHAGVFSTADDLTLFAEMMLAGGSGLFTPLTVTKFTTPQSPADQPVLRGLGWDIDSPLSGNRGELFPIGSYGHSGFTGTSLWIDPASATYVILLANSVHPHIRPALTSVRCRIATVAAAAFGVSAPGVSITGYNETLHGPGLHRVVGRNATALTGLDVLASEKFERLNGRRVGLITNHTGIDRQGQRNVDLMLAGGVKVVALFSPEHGINGVEDQPNVASTTDSATGVPVLSLYSAAGRRPTAEMLRGIDALVFDIQDIGTRFYTYMTTMGYCMQAAAAHHIAFFVLDRPNPITGTHVEGPMLDPDLTSFTAFLPLPVRHGMTAGELARLFNARKSIGAELHVVAMRDWEPGDWFDSTGLPWRDPSPNMRSLNAALLYPGVGLIEASRNYSVGRGTDAPFEQIGADWIRGPELAASLNARFIPGVRTYPTRFQPATANLAGRLIEGVRFVITEREAFDSARLGLEVAWAIGRLYPSKIVLADNRWLIGNHRTIQLLEAGEDPARIQLAGEDTLDAFLKVREQHLLYR
jgi:uncharacterized protein YbbC (DUF1343 family)/CubicO group peptidase (beta-lactamase class C family)